MLKTIIDAATNTVVEIQLTEEEIVERQLLSDKIHQRKITEEAEAQAKAAAKTALLERLGMTEDEAKLLLA
jgi:hypothetical protein